jgi:hypothetical protein
MYLPPINSKSVIEIVRCMDETSRILIRRRFEAEARRSKKAATILLYLQEMGLLYDVAWPIAALACWLC